VTGDDDARAASVQRPEAARAGDDVEPGVAVGDVRGVVTPSAVDRSGLTAGVAAQRLAVDGWNVLPAARRRPALFDFARGLVHFFALMLWAAAAMAWVAGIGSLAIAISAVVVLNALFAFVQQRRADRAAERLRVLLPSEVRVRRDGRAIAVDATEVVVGDVVLLEAGDRIPADASVIVTETVLVDTSLLTGESESVPAVVGDPVFAGTFVVDGDAEAVVTATGAGTRLASIASLTSETPEPTTPLTRELHRVVRSVAVIAVGVGAAFFVLSWLIGESLSDGLVFAIGVTVALVPEALLPTVTLSLAWGAEQMAGKQVLVRHLEAVETLGSTTFVCTDKTGTLTRNEMSVVAAWTPEQTVTVDGLGYGPDAVVSPGPVELSASVDRLARVAVLASTGFATADTSGAWTAHGEPMDAAIDAFARRIGVDSDALRQRSPVVRFAFHAGRRTASAIIADEVVVKGAPDSVLASCGDAPGAIEAFESFTSGGLRVLAVATKAWSPDDGIDRDDAEADLELCGLLALIDPPRDGIDEALRDCRRAGVQVAMLTGDHPATAAAIAERIGLLGDERMVVTGDELPDDDGVLGALLDRDGVVVARVTPEAKLRIARALRGRGHVVAMTGDGVNDAPALHEADIGIAMGRSGTDVAREAADLVLLDDHFASIVAGIEQGRATYLNIRRFLTYHLTDNVAELTPFAVWALSGGQFPLALGVLQILALDLGTDTLSAVALGAEPPAAHVLDGPPVSGHLLDRTVARRAFGLFGPIIAALTMTAFTVSMIAAGWRPGADFPTGDALLTASGAAFMTVVFGQSANAFACRSSTRTTSELGWTSNRLLGPAVLIELAFSVVVLAVPWIARELGQAPPSLAGWCVASSAPLAVFAVDHLDKRHQRRRRGPSR
jgi:magnesium-transporting ATPase (P-type)